MSISPGSLLGYNGPESFLFLVPSGHLNSAQEKQRKGSLNQSMNGCMEPLKWNCVTAKPVRFCCLHLCAKEFYPVSTQELWTHSSGVNSLYSHLLLLRSGHILVNDGCDNDVGNDLGASNPIVFSLCRVIHKFCNLAHQLLGSMNWNGFCAIVWNFYISEWNT